MKTIFTLLISLTALGGISFSVGDNGWYFQNPRSFLQLPVFLLIFYGFKHIKPGRDSRSRVFAAIAAFLLSFCRVLGEILVKKGTSLWLLADFETTLKGILNLFGFTVLFYFIISLCFKGLSQPGSSQKLPPKLLSFPLIWLALIVFWLPWILTQFPAVMTADTTDQIEMALGIEPLTDHHPIFYTMLIKTALEAGKIISNSEPNQAGIILFSLCQFTAMTAVCAGILSRISKDDALRKQIFPPSLVFFLLYPVNPLYSITIWKDVPFAVCLLYLISLLSLEIRKHERMRCIQIALSGILLTLFRHNGFYITLLSIPFIPFLSKNKRKPLLFTFSFVILFAFLWNQLLLPALHIPAGSPAEALSIPMQQIVLTAKRHHTTMDENTLAELTEWFENQKIWEKYTYRISDPVKNLFNDNRYQSSPKDFWKFWFKLGKTYPQDYLDGFLLHTYGYWYPETPHWVFVTGIDDDGLFGIHSDPKLKTEQTTAVLQWLSDAEYDKIPLISLLFSPGACFWVYVICFCYCLYKKKQAAYLFIPLVILWLTALASPVNCEFRYVYAMFLCFPVIFMGCVQKN